LATQELGGQHHSVAFLVLRAGGVGLMVLNAKIGCWFRPARPLGAVSDHIVKAFIG
jgi:hypothetical protein